MKPIHFAIILTFLATLLVYGAANAQGNAAAYNAQGVESYNAKRWSEAIDAFLRAYELAPNNETVRRNLSNAYQAAANELAQTGNIEAAAEYLEVAITIDARSAAPLVQLGSYYLRLGLPTDAAYRLEEAIGLDPENADAHELLGNAYYDLHDLAGALAEWEYVMQVDPARKRVQEKLAKATREEAVEGRFRADGSQHFDLKSAPEGLGRDSRFILTVLERAYRDIGNKLGRAFPPAGIAVIIYSENEFQEATAAGEHVGALYDGKIRVPYKDVNGKRLPDEEIQRRLYHEYTHVVVHYLLEDKAPWWLNEGLAETLSRDDLSSHERAILRQAAEQGALTPLSGLEAHQLTVLDAGALTLAYSQAHATVRHLTSPPFSMRNMHVMIDALARGFTPEEALKQAYRRDYAIVERELAQKLRP